MRFLLSVFVCLLLAACSTPDPIPEIFGLEEGTVTTIEQELVPLKNYREPGYTQVFLLPVGHVNSDPAKGPIDVRSRERSVAFGTYAQGFSPDLIISPNNAIGSYQTNAILMSQGLEVRNYEEGASAEAITALTKGGGASRIVVIASPEMLVEVANSMSANLEMEWPVNGEEAVVYFSYNDTEGSVQPFAISKNELDN